MPIYTRLGAMVTTTLVHGISGEPARKTTTVFSFDNESDGGVWPVHAEYSIRSGSTVNDSVSLPGGLNESR